MLKMISERGVACKKTKRLGKRSIALIEDEELTSRMILCSRSWGKKNETA